MNKLKELVSETLTTSRDEVEIEKLVARVTGYRRDNYPDLKSYLEDAKPIILKSLWSNAFNLDYTSYMTRTNNASCIRYHYDKMSITKWIASPIDKIGKDKTFYFIGKRFTKVSIINSICEHYNWTWEKSDPKKADFFILGDSPSIMDASLNRDLKKPVLMDEDLRSANHFLFNPEVTIDDIDNDLISNYLNKCTYDNLKLVASMIQYLEDGVLSDANKYRLIRSYVATFKDRVTFDLKNKDHVWLSDTVLNYCHRQHRHLVTAKYLKTATWYNSLDEKSGIHSVVTYSNAGSGYVGSNINGFIPVNFSNIHSCEGMDEVIEIDNAEFNEHAVVKKPTFNNSTKYITLNANTLVQGEMYSVRLGFYQNPVTIAYYCRIVEGKVETLGCGASDSIYESRVISHYIREVFSMSDWDSIIRPKIEKLLVGNLRVNDNDLVLDMDYIAGFIDLDETMTNLNIKQSKIEKLKFTARKLALIG